MRRNQDSSHDQPEWLSELSEVVDSLPDLVATFDRDGRLLMINAAGIETLGHPQPTLAQLLISDLYPEPDAERIIDDALQCALEHGSWSGCAPLRNADGNCIETHQRWIAHQLHERKARAFTLVARPLDESCAEVELRNRRESVVAMSLGLVHDLNNLLGPIGAYADLAATAIDRNKPATRYLEQITEAAKRGHALAMRLADLTRAQEPTRSVVDIAGIAREIVRWLRVARPDLHIELSHDDVVTEVMGDPVQLHQVVLNLAQNSTEALSDRPGSVHIRIDHALHPEQAEQAEKAAGRYLRLDVVDDGRGIEETARSRIFEPFFSTKPSGSGLGLNVSQEIVRSHNGILTVEPVSPTGTIARVYLPLDSAG